MPMNTAAASLPPGVVVPFAGATAPQDWLLCYGQAISRTTYALLFAAIGTAHGVGDGATTFNLPDLRGRIPVGKDDMGGSAASRLTTAGAGVDGATLGAVGGTQTHTLTAEQMPSHSHSITLTSNDGSPSTPQAVVGPCTAGGPSYTGSAASSSAGSGSAHNNVQPSLVASYIIKT